MRWIKPVLVVSASLVLAGCGFSLPLSPKYSCSAKNLTTGHGSVGYGATKKKAKDDALSSCAKGAGYSWRCSIKYCHPI